MMHILLMVLSFFIFYVHADTDTKKRIFILHSYSQEYKWTKLQHENFVASLEASVSSPLEISTEYLDTKRLKFKDEYQSFFLHYLQDKYKAYRPDVIYVTDDNALKFFLNHKNALFENTPLFFSGVNDLTLAPVLDPNKFVGVYETKDLEPNIELIDHFSPQTRDVWIVGDASTTYHSIEDDIKKKIYKFPKYTFHFVSSDNIEDVISQLPKVPKSFVLLTTIGDLRDHHGNNLTLKQSIRLLKHNPHLIVCSMEDAYMVDGVVGGFVASGSKQGSVAAGLVARYFHGEPIRTIHSIIKSPNVYMFNRHEVMKARLILSEYTARNAIILNEKENFFEKYQHLILNAVFILFILFLLFLISVYFIAAQKKAHLQTVEGELAETSAELSKMKEKLALLEHPDE